MTQRTQAMEKAFLRTKAMTLLARREHTRAELYRKLVQRGFPPEQVTTLIQELTDAGLLSEERYAAAYVRSRANKGYGPRRIAWELRAQGIAQEQIDRVLAEWADEWVPLLQALHRKRFRSQEPAGSTKRMQQIQVLSRRGFSREQIEEFFASPREEKGLG